MFGLALVDRKAGTLLLARDRSGIKPVHYLKTSEAFLFASEVKSIWSAVGPGGLAPDRERLREVISLGYPYGTTTPFQGVRTLPGGMALELDLATGDFSIRTFHDLLGDLTAEAWREREGRSEERVEKDLETAVSASVTAHLVSDAPVGVICSGGVDSSLIAAMAVRQVPNLELFHAAVEGPGSEESYARLVAEPHRSQTARGAGRAGKNFFGRGLGPCFTTTSRRTTPMTRLFTSCASSPGIGA